VEIFDAFSPIPDGAIAGAAAGVVVETALYPIDTVKTRLQVSKIEVYIFKDCSEN
jgi:solute carrier family 25 S-adenosylmethionine transporter 26